MGRMVVAVLGGLHDLGKVVYCTVQSGAFLLLRWRLAVGIRTVPVRYGILESWRSELTNAEVYRARHDASLNLSMT